MRSRREGGEGEGSQMKSQGVALVVGGTRGIGKALVSRLQDLGWTVVSTGHADLDLADPRGWDQFMQGLLFQQFDFVCFCAGEIDAFPWDRKSAEDYIRAYWIHALGPVMLLAQYPSRFPWWCKIAFVSSVGAVNDGIVDLGYGMAKAALDKAAKALAKRTAWGVYLIRLDLVSTDTMYRLPTESLHGRAAITPDDAAKQIMEECGI